MSAVNGARFNFYSWSYDSDEEYGVGERDFDDPELKKDNVSEGNISTASERSEAFFAKPPKFDCVVPRFENSQESELGSDDSASVKDLVFWENVSMAGETSDKNSDFGKDIEEASGAGNGGSEVGNNIIFP